MLEEIVGPLLSWYQENKRELPWRTEPTPYHVWGIGDHAPADPGGSCEGVLRQISGGPSRD